LQVFGCELFTAAQPKRRADNQIIHMFKHMALLVWLATPPGSDRWDQQFLANQLTRQRG
jgi:hypothetical protein